MDKKRIIVFIISIILILFGLSGTALSTFFITKANEFVGNLKQIESINTSIKGGFESITNIASDTHIATVNIASSIKNARQSLQYAADTSKESASAVYSIADLTGFDIFGFKPLEEAGDYFTTIGDNLNLLSQKIEDTANSLQTNEKDVIKLGEDFKEASLKLNMISSELSQTTTLILEGNFIKMINIILIYMAILHFMFIIIGVALITLTR
ncbi:MAG: hypothetical protein FJW69_03420 [Actinobacteria bacterium]|nr:hypothetical protein [Actinomycetota bacterium]MBM3713613.1 hypothetical protein [Actinomycetota bacterium]